MAWSRASALFVPGEGRSEDLPHAPEHSGCVLSGITIGSTGARSFATNTSLAAGAYLVCYANDADGTSGIHLGFSLNQDGNAVYLYDKTSSGGALLDSVGIEKVLHHGAQASGLGFSQRQKVLPCRIVVGELA